MENKEISKITLGAMIATALFFDGIQAGTIFIYPIPFVGLILGPLIAGGVSFFAFMTFSFWFYLVGMKFNGKIVSTTVGAFFIELIPVLNALPGWTLSVVLVFVLSKTKKIVAVISPEAGHVIDKVGGKKT